MPTNFINLDRHLAWCRARNLSPATIYMRRRVLLAVAAFAGLHALVPGSGLSRLSATVLLAWQSQMAEMITPGALANYTSHLRSFYGWCQAEGIRADNPAERLASPKLPRRLPRPIGTADLMLAMQTAPARVRPWLACAAWGGMRCIEIALLRRENVFDGLAQPFIRIAADATKGSNERDIPMNGVLRAELAPVLPRRGWVFPRHDGQAGPNKPNMVSKLGGEHLASLGLPDTMHSLRHWFGTNAYEGTHDLRAVQELMGHRSSRSTDGYTRISGSALIAAVNSLPQL